MNGFFERLKRARSARPGLDYLLIQTGPDKPLRERLLWLEELLEWMRRPAKVAKSSLDFGSGQGQSARVRYLLQVLDGNPAAKQNVASTMRSLIRDVDAVDLFRGIGLPGGFGLAAEAWDRVASRITPRYHEGRDLGDAFELLFPDPRDGVWIGRLDDETLTRLGALLAHGSTPEDQGWNTLFRELAEAIVLLADEVRVLGLSGQVRRQLPDRERIDSPFRALSEEARIMTRTLGGDDEGAMLREVRAFQTQLAACKREIDGVRWRLRERGLSLALVFQIDRLEAMLERNQILVSLLASRGRIPRELSSFVVRLIEENARRKSVRALWDDTVALLAKRITERNAVTGEHYIARDKDEYRTMVRSAAGGGVLTSATIIMKIMIEGLATTGFIKGALATLNYSGSFLAIQAFDFTLATKQPAMTAAAIAESITDLSDDRNVVKLAQELIQLIRSQVAAILGNLLTVVPAIAVLHFGILLVRGRPFVTEEYAKHVIEAHSLIGPTPLFAAFTGVLLWESSLMAGMFDNWVAYRRLPEALAANRKLAIILGPLRLQRLAGTVRRQAAGVGGNVSLGFLLGGFPKILASLGLPLEARHVTLSTGSVALAMLCIGRESLTDPNTWLAVAGIASCGVLNLGVSFSLSMIVAERAKRVRSEKRMKVYRAVLSRIIRRPLRLFLPVGLD